MNDVTLEGLGIILVGIICFTLGFFLNVQWLAWYGIISVIAVAIIVFALTYKRENPHFSD